MGRVPPSGPAGALFCRADRGYPAVGWVQAGVFDEGQVAEGGTEAGNSSTNTGKDTSGNA